MFSQAGESLFFQHSVEVEAIVSIQVECKGHNGDEQSMAVEIDQFISAQKGQCQTNDNSCNDENCT